MGKNRLWGAMRRVLLYPLVVGCAANPVFQTAEILVEDANTGDHLCGAAVTVDGKSASQGSFGPDAGCYYAPITQLGPGDSYSISVVDVGFQAANVTGTFPPQGPVVIALQPQ